MVYNFDGGVQVIIILLSLIILLLAINALMQTFKKSPGALLGAMLQKYEISQGDIIKMIQVLNPTFTATDLFLITLDIHPDPKKVLEVYSAVDSCITAKIDQK